MQCMLKQIRQSHHQSQTQLAAALEISPRILADYEKGAPPKLDTAYRIAAYYQVDIREIFPPECYEFANGPCIYTTIDQLTIETYFSNAFKTPNYPLTLRDSSAIKRADKKI